MDDLADACVFLMNKYDDNGIINIGTGVDFTIRELAVLIRNILKVRIKISWDTARPDGTMLKRLDVSRLNNLGWTPSISLRNGIKETYRWYLNQL